MRTKLKLLFAIMVLSTSVIAQTNSLTLEQVWQISRENYPLIKQRDLIRRTADLSIENINSNYYPQVALLGQASWQSDVTHFNISVPGVKAPLVPQDQYKIAADLSQTIYDGGINRQQKQVQDLNASVETEKVEVELYKLKERITQVYLAILFLDEQLSQTELIRADLKTAIKTIDAQVTNGVAFRSSLNLLQAELLKADQRTVELNATRKGYVETLGVFLNQKLPIDVKLERPQAPMINSTINRPELKLFASQDKLIDAQDNLIDAKNTPRASVFMQGGYGRPGLNMLDDNFKLFYIGGLRLNWSLSGFYTSKKEKEIIELSRKTVDVQKEAFLLNTRASLTQQQAEIDKLQQLVATDQEIIQLREKVKQAAQSQLDNGVITPNDFLSEVNAEDQARRQLITHQLQLLQAQINYQIISGN